MKTACRLTLITLLVAVSNLSAATLYVSLESTNPTPPFTNWVTAATNIQDAVDAAGLSDLVLVTNGVYQMGGTKVLYEYFANRVAVTKPITLQSVNGPTVTTIVGSRGNPSLGIPYVRCVFLTNGAALIGFTLTNGSVPGGSYVGGGVFALGRPPITPSAVIGCVLASNTAGFEGGGACGVFLDGCFLIGNSAGTGGGAAACGLNKCTISSNSASGTGGIPSDVGSGGGAYRCNMTNCLVTGNSASQSGGGVCGGLLNNCTVSSNTAYSGGGVSLPVSGTTYLTNCIVFYNSATSGPNYLPGMVFSHCCTAPPPQGTGNITNEPNFLDLTNGNFHLQTNSPCINAGLNSAVVSPTDLDGNPRIVSGTVDIGAYEYQGIGSRISYAWLQQYGLATDGSADFIDSDHDGMKNWQEWICGTDPTNPQSVLSLLSATPTSTNATVTWQSVAGVNYSLERSANLAAPFMLLATNIVGQAGTTSYADTNAAGGGPLFYRVGVQAP